ncbi:MAG: DUF359 domain-containing protein [Candidatus Nezhaarchaeota archaeon]|nr:DUF359 domain-containing protein [Candidatus Nezhaarchaeota archaeon]
MEALRLPSRLRPVLQRPLGRLLKGRVEEIYASLRSLVEEARPPRLVAVGDVVIEDSLRHGLSLDLAIGDLKTKRIFRGSSFKGAFKEAVKVRNPAGLITIEACRQVARCLEKGGGVLIEVEGEEDLLAIPCVIYAPVGSVVIYGQPDEGVVAMVVSEELKAFFKSLLDAFEKVNYVGGRPGEGVPNGRTATPYSLDKDRGG